MKTAKMKVYTMICALAAIVLMAGQAQAAFTDFTAAEGYTNGNLHGQVTGEWWCQNTNSSGLIVDTDSDGGAGYVTWHSNLAYWGETVTLDDRGDTAITKLKFRYNAIEKIPGNENNSQIANIRFAGGGNIVRAYLRRTESKTGDANKSRMTFQIASSGTGGQTAISLCPAYEVYTGVSSTGVGQTDWLEYSASLMRGSTRLDWKLEVIVKNLTTDEVVFSGRWKIKTSSDFHNAPDHTYTTSISCQDDADAHIVPGSRQIDSIEFTSVANTINYDEVCDGNVDGAKSNAEEGQAWTEASGDPWYEWGYLGGSSFCRVKHDKYGKMASHRNSDAAVNQKGRKWLPGLGRAVEIDETIEWSVNYQMFASSGLGEQVGMDLYLTSNSAVTPGSPDPSTKISYSINQVNDVPDPDEYLKMLGVRISQDDNTGDGSWVDGSMAVQLKPALNYSGIGSDSGVTGWINLNDIGIAGTDRDGDHLKVTYRAKKTEIAPYWDCSVVISNRETGASWVFTDDGVTNAPLYNAGAAIYPTVYDPKGFDGSPGDAGFGIDDLICRILYTNYFDLPPGPWVVFVDDYGLSGVKTDDDDGDDMNDWGEYVFGGNPTNSEDVGVLPTFDPDAGNYGFSLIGDDDVIAHVVTNTDLITGSWGTNSTVTVLVTDGVLSNYTDHIGTAADQVYIKLLVE